MTWTTSLLHSLALSLLLGLTACGGAEGGVCQLREDCSSGLMCCKGGTSLTDRGVCQVTCSDVDPRDMGVTDLGSPDLGRADAGAEDATMSEDLGAVDMSMPLDLGVDAGMSEDLGVDAGMSVDLGPADAGSESDAGDGG